MNANIVTVTSEQLSEQAKTNARIYTLIQDRKRYESELRDSILSQSEVDYIKGRIVSINNQLSTIKGRI